MNLMPFKCSTREAGECKYDCDYIYYGRMPFCFVPVLVPNKPYDGNPINELGVLKEYFEVTRT